MAGCWEKKRFVGFFRGKRMLINIQKTPLYIQPMQRANLAIWKNFIILVSMGYQFRIGKAGLNF
jgi:hypothetical protein